MVLSNCWRCGLLGLAALALFTACSASPTGTPGPTPSPSPWPTLVALGPTQALPETAASPEATLNPIPSPVGITAPDAPERIEHFRVSVEPGLTAVFPLRGYVAIPVRIEVIVLSGAPDPTIDLRNDQGDQLLFSDNAGPSEPEVIGQFQFPVDGYYELGLSSASLTGELGVSVFYLPAESGFAEAFQQIPQEVRGAITQPASYHSYRLMLERGRRVDIVAEAFAERLDLVFRLYSPRGVELAARDDNDGKNPALWNFMPGESGWYTLVLSNFDDNVGEYVLRLTEAQGGAAAQLGVRSAITLESTPRRSSWLTFEGRALDAVRIETRPLSPGVDVAIQLYDPYGHRLVDADSFGPDQPEQVTLVQLPVSGIFQVEFTTLGEAGEIEYFIRPESGADLDQGGLISAGGPGQTGEFVGPASLISWVFDVEAGALIGLDAHATESTGLDLGFTLLSPDGDILIERDDSVGLDPVIDRYEVPLTGRYVLMLWNKGRSTGPYDVFVTRPEGAIALPTP